MTMGWQPTRRRAAPRGVWLAVLALAGQVLLPFLLAVEIALAAPQIDGDNGAALCLAAHHAALPTPPSGDRTGHRTPPADCPICQVLATALPFPQPTSITLAVPTDWTAVTRSSAPSRRPTLIATVSYRSRGPPSSI
jgi:hypothetical protein